jgi:putative PEP-CTERM system histidine kinase
MNPNLATVAFWSYLLAGAGYTAFAVYLAFGWRGGPRGRILVLATALTALWALVELAFVVVEAPVLYVAGTMADMLRIGAWYAFLLLIARRPPADAAVGKPRNAGGLVTLAVALVALGVMAQLLVAMGLTVFGDPGWLLVVDRLVLTVFGLVLVEQLYRSLPEDVRWNVKPLCLGLTAAFIFDLYLFAEALLFNRVDADAWSVRGIAYALVIPLIAISTTRNPDWTFGIALSRRVVFHSTALIGAGAYLLFMAAAGYYIRYFGGNWGRALQVALMFAGLLVFGTIALSGSMRAKLRVIVSKHFFSYRYDYRDEWLRFTQALSGRGGQRQLGQDVIRGLADMLESPAGALWLRDTAGRQFVQSARWNMPPNPAPELADSPFIEFLSATGWVVNLEEFRSSPERYRGMRLPPWLSELPNAWLVIPLATGSELIGFVIVATARTRVDVNWEVNDLLKTAARQAATFLGQMQATEALLEARKFEAFNRMSAFVVHDLKNIVAQLSLMLKNAERHRENPEFQKDMLMTVDHSVERMKQLMMQLREGSTPVDVAHTVDLAAVIVRVQRAKTGLQPPLELQLEDEVTTRGHADRLERVIGHLVQNAIDATGEGGRVWIRLAKDGDRAVVEVGDTGCGMSPEFVQERLFKPFQTTKATGMGIGAYESFQYVQELGGSVQVSSTPNSGTNVKLVLPLFDPQPGALASTHRVVA